MRKRSNTGAVQANERWNCALVVAGPREAIESFEETVRGQRLRRPGATSVEWHEVPEGWFETRDLGLSSLVTLLPPEGRAGARRALGRRLTEGSLMSRKETAEGRVRLEYHFDIKGEHSGLTNLVKSLSEALPEFTFAIALVDEAITRGFSEHYSTGEVLRSELPPARSAKRRTPARRTAADDDFAVDFAHYEAAQAALEKLARHFDRFLAVSKKEGARVV